MTESNGSSTLTSERVATLDDLREALNLLTGGNRLPWEVQTSCSFRRIGSAPGGDGDVLHAWNHRDGHPDLSMGEEKLEALVLIVNGLSGVLDRAAQYEENQSLRERLDRTEGERAAWARMHSELSGGYQTQSAEIVRLRERLQEAEGALREANLHIAESVSKKRLVCTRWKDVVAEVKEAPTLTAWVEAEKKRKDGAPPPVRDEVEA